MNQNLEFLNFGAFCPSLTFVICTSSLAVPEYSKYVVANNTGQKYHCAFSGHFDFRKLTKADAVLKQNATELLSR